VVFLLILITVSSLTALLSGGAFLDFPLPGGLPLGNLVAACALCAPAGAAIRLSPANTLVLYVSVASLVAACAWLPVSIAVAGNLMLNFGDAHGETWVALTLATTVVAYASLLWAGIHRLIARRRRRE